MRLIDADTLPRHKQLESFGNGQYENVEIVYGNDIDNAPTIDAVPKQHLVNWAHVTRCKDCKHHDPEDKKCDCGHAIQWQVPRDDDWFCADGERKDNETD